jgi:hypothetical protein
MDIKRLLNTSLGIATVLAAISLPVRADDIDEKQANLQSKINEAKAAKLLSAKDAHTLNDEMAKFNKKKGALRTASGGALTLQDDQELDKSLSTINQDFETRKKEPPAKKK